MKNILFLFMSVFMVSALSANIPIADGNGYKIGDKATDFSLKGTDDQMHSLADFEGVNGYVVVFTCNTCPYSKMYEDRLIALASSAEEIGFGMVAINSNDPEVSPGDSFDQMKARAADKSFNFPYLMDEGQEIFPQYGATKTPHVFVLDKDMVVKYIGAVDDNARDAAAVQQEYVKSAMMAIKGGGAPDPAETKAIGCSIKTKA